jgi:Tol biopolymer transport system component
MNDRLDLLVTDWLRSDAPAQASPQVLADAMARVATAGQERYVTQRLLGDSIGRRRDVRLALALGLALIALAGTVALAGAFLQRPLPTGPLSNGPIVFRANGQAGANLTLPVTETRSGDTDLYAFDVAGGIQRIAGDDADHQAHACPAVSPDGRYLAYQELDLTSVTPTQAPVPEGQPFGPAPANVGPLRYVFSVVRLDSDGKPIGEAIRIPAPGPADSIIDCARWSPDSSRMAIVVDPPDGTGGELWVASLDGRTMLLDRGPSVPGAVGTVDWAPDGRSLVVARESEVSVVPADGRPARQLQPFGADAVAWSPDGSRIAITRPRLLRVVSPDGRELFVRSASVDGDPTVLWSPDSRWVVHIRDGALNIDPADASWQGMIDVLEQLYPDGPPDDASFRILAWSPDSRRLLLAVSTGLLDELVTVGVVGDAPLFVVVEPTQALRGVRAGQVTWVGVHS